MVEIRGVRFHFVEEADGGMNQARHSKGYVTFRNGKCYYMGTTVGTSSAVDPPAKLMTKRDWAEIHSRWIRLATLFAFLK